MMVKLASARQVKRVRHELRRREVEVIRIAPVGAGFVGVTFGGDALEDFVSDSFDDHVKFMFEDASGEQQRRDYTPRHFDRKARSLTIEFALHGEGKAAQWAQQAVPGQKAIIGGPRGSMIIPLDYDWHLLAGDASALPAISRRLEELPAGTKAIVLAQIDDEADRRDFDSNAQLEVRWMSSTDELEAAVRATDLPPGDGFAWGAGEAAAMRRLREILHGEKGMPKEALRISAYWKDGSSSFHENLE